MTDRPAPTVTVPVEPTEAMRPIPDRVLTEALYWMARAYERVHSMPRVSDTELANKIEAAKADLGRARDASPILSAPAAPQAAGVVEATLDAWRDFEGDHLTDGKGNASAETYRLCRAAFEAGASLRAPSREPEGGAVDDRLHSAISKLKDWVGLIQLRKNGGCVSGNPIVDCVNDLPAIIRELEAAELEIEGAFERYEDAIAPREEAPADHVSDARQMVETLAPTCQKCGGEIAGWCCQQCPAEFRENDDGVLIFDTARIIFPEDERVKMDREWGGNRSHSRARWNKAIAQAREILALRAQPQARSGEGQ